MTNTNRVSPHTEEPGDGLHGEAADADEEELCEEELCCMIRGRDLPDLLAVGDVLAAFDSALGRVPPPTGLDPP